MNERKSVIRPGQHKPYVKGTNDQINARVGLIVRLLQNGAGRSDIHRAVRKKFGVEWRQTDRNIAMLKGLYWESEEGCESGF